MKRATSSAAACLLLGALPLLAAAAPVRRIPFAWTPGQIEIPVSVNGGAPVTFLLDTGSEYSIVSTALAAQLGLRTAHRFGRDFATGVTLSFGGVELPGQEVMVMPFDGYHKRGRAIEGLIGYDFFARYVVRIDFHARALEVREPSSFRLPAGARALPLRFTGRIPLVEVGVVFPGRKPITARAALDTGASATLMLRYPFANARRLLELGTTEETSPSLASGELRLVRLPAQRLTFAGWSFDQPLVKVFLKTATGSGAYTDSDAILGNEVLRRFLVTVDYSRKILGLEPGPELREPFVR